MSVVYLLSSHQKMSQKGGRIEILTQEGEKKFSLVLSDIDSVVVGSYTQISTEVMFTLLKNQIPISYVDWSGKLLGSLCNNQIAMERFYQQVDCFSDANQSLSLIRYIIGRKMKNQRRLLMEYARRRKEPLLKEFAENIRFYEKKLDSVETPEEIRGMEGMASRVYFEALGLLLEPVWGWSGRNRRPPRDPVNSMLGYGYAFLEHEVRIALAGARLDSRLGFFHSNNGRKDSLVYDVLELFRQNVIDKFVLKLVHCHVLKPADFSQDKEKGCLFREEAKRTWAFEYEKYMELPRKMLSNNSWRTYIRKEIEILAEERIFSAQSVQEG